MIIGNLLDWKRYNALHPLFEQAFRYLIENDFSKMEIGRVNLDGDNLFAIISDSDMKIPKEAKLEVHNRYLDIQMPVSRSERFGWAARKDMQIPTASFDEEKDIQFFDDASQTYFDLQPQQFVVFYSEDAHAPLVGSGSVRKVIMKVKI